MANVNDISRRLARAETAAALVHGDLRSRILAARANRRL